MRRSTSILLGVLSLVASGVREAAATAAPEKQRIRGQLEAGPQPVVAPTFENARLVPSDGDLGQLFGIRVAVSDSTIVVGASEDDDNGGFSGSAYVFTRPADGWSGALGEAAKLLASNGSPGDVFGASVAVSGDTIVIGAGLANPAGIDSGAAYVFTRPAGGWSGILTEAARLLPSDGGPGVHFGRSVGVLGDTIVVGAPGEPSDDATAGAAYVFTKPPGGWSGMLAEDAKLLASDGVPGDFFGGSVSTFAGAVVVGAALDFVGGVRTGSARVFSEPAGGWSGTLFEDATLLASDRAMGDDFASSVAAFGSTVVAGTPGDDDLGTNSGSAYVFPAPPGGWSGILTETAKLVPSDGAAFDTFGRSVAHSAGRIVVGAPRDGDQGFLSGSAYVFTEPPGGWTTGLTEGAKLLASDGAEFDDFGTSVAVFANTIAVGAPFADQAGASSSGSAYVFEADATALAIPATGGRALLLLALALAAAGVAALRALRLG